MYDSFDQLLNNAAQAYPLKTAIVCGGETINFDDLNKRSSQCAKALQTLGINKGDRVSLISVNSINWVVAYYGIIKSGAIINPLVPIAELASAAIDDCAAVALIGSAELVNAILADSTTSCLQHAVAFNAPTSLLDFDELISSENEDYQITAHSPNDLAAICYTSGTTGTPKGAMLSHHGLLMNAKLAVAMHNRTAQDIVITALPCFHAYGVMVLNTGIAAGMTTVLHADFQPEAVLASINQYQATLFEGMPNMFLQMLASDPLKKYDISSLSRMTMAGETISVDKFVQLETHFGCPILQLWGQTEISGIGTGTLLDGPRKLGSTGIALPYVENRIAHWNNYQQDMPINQIGELLIKSQNTMLGYYNKPEITAQTIESDGWLHTGDAAYKDDEGFVYIIDRLVDRIEISGQSVFPAEIERVISNHPQVVMCGVIGIANTTTGQQAKAFVLLKDEKPLDTDALQKHCRAYLDEYKVPRMIQIVNSLPVTASGKLLRRELFKL